MAYVAAIHRWFEDWDFLLTPSVSVAAFPAELLMPKHWPQHEWDWVSWAEFSYPFNMSWNPAASVPCGFTADGLAGRTADRRPALRRPRRAAGVGGVRASAALGRQASRTRLTTPHEPGDRRFLLGFPALFSIVNPISGAFIFREVTAVRADQRARLARQVALYSLVVMTVALWAGSFVLGFFGITLAALRVAGGIVVALSAWNLLNAPEERDARKQQQAAASDAIDDVALFPLTIPITTGPGTISVAITLGSGHPRAADQLVWFFLGMTAATVALAIVIWITYRSADRISRLMGPGGSRTVTRLSAFLLLCIGVQILIAGVEDVLTPLLAHH